MKIIAYCSSMLGEGKTLIKWEEGRIVVQPPEDVMEYVNRRTVVFRGKSIKTGNIKNPPVKEVLPHFTK